MFQTFRMHDVLGRLPSSGVGGENTFTPFLKVIFDNLLINILQFASVASPIEIE